MAIDRGFVAIACTSIGAAAIVFAWSAGAFPAPVGDGAFDRDVVLPGLRAAAVAVDAACARGDGVEFAAATTEAHRRQLAQKLAAVDRVLDADTLRAMAAQPFAACFRREPLAGIVDDQRVAVAMPHHDGAGASVLVFVWDGWRWLLDVSQQHRAVADAAAARELLVRALQRTP